MPCWQEIKENSFPTKVTARYRHTAIVIHDSMYVFGWDPEPSELCLPTFTWKPIDTKGDIPAPRKGFSLVSKGYTVYLFAGYGSYSCTDRYNDLYSFSFITMTWKKIEATGDIPMIRSYHTAALDETGENMYVFGGYSNNNVYLDDFYCYNLSSKRWKKLDIPGRPAKRCNHSCVTYKGEMYIFGGSNTRTAFNDLHKFNFDTQKWTLIETTGDIPSKRKGHTAVVYAKHMYVFAGSDFKNHVNNELFKYNFEQKRWSRVENGNGITAPKSWYHSAVVCKDSMIVFGGCPANNKLYKFTFDVDTSLSQIIEKLYKKQFVDISFE